MKYLLIFIEGQMDWLVPEAHGGVVLEEPSGTCSYAIVKKANESPEQYNQLESVAGSLLARPDFIAQIQCWVGEGENLLFLSFLFSTSKVN